MHGSHRAYGDQPFHGMSQPWATAAKKAIVHGAAPLGLFNAGVTCIWRLLKSPSAGNRRLCGTQPSGTPKHPVQKHPERPHAWMGSGTVRQG